ncbi:cadherin-like beta sandwich domain-containing protein [Peribacillus frigoritolerans]|uniref:cadherin-like beta sandwich domain-containing protein n=1 Tax=Peribacillus frigoritolerans TaxID=450367 RepID=UPI002079E2DD|nr:cadherin-like beta sandwich domain-containing protein [Peribacillus frigoritolerans]USK82827.1 cadherin-like beta sandwich domain-containing protein [Peribacillus frigoritolerans]WJE50088.1 cadherin-like beta sandwich domain-containing protein [Peribacillus frigoritolerans]
MKKGLKETSVKVILVGSLVGMGKFTYMPGAEAAEGTSVILEEAQTVNSLSKLEIEGIALDQKFTEDVHDYSSTVGNDVEKITLLAASPNENAAIYVNGVKMTDGKLKDLTLQTGMSTFVITVSDGENETVTYTLKVEKHESDDNLLTSIGLSKGSLTFNSKVKAYHASVENEVQSVTVTPILSDSKAIVKVNGKDATSAGVKVTLPVGKTTVKITVTAEIGDEKTYTLTITRAAAAAKETESKAAPKEDEVQKEPSTGTSKTQPSSDKGNKSSISSAGSSDKGNKTSLTSAESSNNQKPSSGVSQVTNAQQIESISTQKVKTDSVEKVTSADSLGEEGNNGPVLNSLTVSSGVWNKSFESNEHTYHIEVDNDISSVEMNATTNASGATIEYDGASNAKVKIKDKAKTAISVTVSKDGERRTYVLVFEKDMDVEMDEEETVDDVKTKEVEVEAAQTSTAGMTESETSNDSGGQINGKQPVGTVSFFGNIKDFFTSLLK